MKVRDELQQLPAVGPSIAADLRRLDVKSVKDLARRDPERHNRLLRAGFEERDVSAALEPYFPSAGEPQPDDAPARRRGRITGIRR